jgi:hypothetical protein
MKYVQVLKGQGCVIELGDDSDADGSGAVPSR